MKNPSTKKIEVHRRQIVREIRTRNEAVGLSIPIHKHDAIYDGLPDGKVTQELPPGFNNCNNLYQ